LIHIKLTAQGEPDVVPLTREYRISNKQDEEIFFNMVTSIKEKLEKNFRININECITLYCAFVLSEIQNNKPIDQIPKNVSSMLGPQKVMIGVPDMLRQMSFEVTLNDSTQRRITVNEPIQILDYILKPN